MSTNIAGLLHSVFPGLGQPEIETLSRTVKVNAYPAGAVLCREGETEHTFYVIADGQVSIQRQMAQASRELAVRGPGEYFGEMALLDNQPRSASVVTLTGSTLVEISEDVFNALVARNPSASLSLIRHLTSVLRDTDKKSIADLTRQNIELQKAYADLKAAQAELVAKERLERELEIAAQVQRSLLPGDFPPRRGYTFAGRNVPARSVGGDLFDVISLDDDHVGLLMADVSDKSIHAALIMAVTRTLFLSESRRSLAPEVVALAVHRGLKEVSTTDDMFVTAFYGVLHLDSGHLRYVRAGQDKPLWLHADGRLETLEAEGRFLGMINEIHLEQRSIVLEPGDTLTMYSDGVTDAVDVAGETYDLERLLDIVESLGGQPAQAVCDAIFKAVGDYRGLAAASDDVTVLVAARTGDHGR